MEQELTCSAYAKTMGGSEIWLKEGERMTVEELLKALVVASANDAAVVFAEAIAASEEEFVRLMNEKAQQLGLQNTHFVNCTGFDEEGHYTCAQDVAVLARELMTGYGEQLTRFSTIWMDSLRGGETQLVNTNRLIRFYDGATGLKTGTTDAAGHCLCATATRDGLSLISVIMGCKSSDARFEESRQLLDYGFAAYRAAPVPLPQERPLQLKVKGSTEETVLLDYAALPATALLPAESAGQLTVQLELPDTLEAPVTRGQTVGKAQLLCSEAVQGEYPVCAAADAPRMDFDTALQLLWDSLRGAAA